MRYAMTCCLLLTSTVAYADEPESVSTEAVTEDQLRELGNAVADVRTYKDNAFLYEEQTAAVKETARSLEGRSVDVIVEVLRVSRLEVFVAIREPGRMRLTLKHSKLPEFGSLGTREYYAQPSASDYRLFAKPVGLRIGSEIDEELAKTLRRYDALLIQGRVDEMRVKIESVFKPFVATVVSDWKVVGLTDDDEPSRVERLYGR